MLAAYITFDGNTEEVFNFYKNGLGGTITNLQRFGDAPHGAEMPGADKNKIMHIALEAPGGIHLMGNDHIGEAFRPGNNFSLSLHPDTKEEADKYFQNLSAGGNVIVPMSMAPWGDYFGMFTDKFGMKWMINHAKKM